MLCFTEGLFVLHTKDLMNIHKHNMVGLFSASRIYRETSVDSFCYVSDASMIMNLNSNSDFFSITLKYFNTNMTL